MTMSRKNIFDIVNENTDLSVEVDRIQDLFNGIDTIESSIHGFTLYDIIDDDLFENWKRRGHCLDLDDFLSRMQYGYIKDRAYDGGDDLLLFIELIYNFWWLVQNKLNTVGSNLHTNRDFHLLKEIMDDVLAQVNYKIYELPEQECILVGENKPEVTSVAEIVDRNIAIPVIRYNHFSLKGDIEAKKAILLALGNDLEPKRPRLDAVNKRLTSDIFTLLNNLNLRHNNIDPTIPANYRKCVTDMDQATLETWYDELYQMMLLAYLLLDNEERKKKIIQLNSKLSEKRSGSTSNCT